MRTRSLYGHAFFRAAKVRLFFDIAKEKARKKVTFLQKVDILAAKTDKSAVGTLIDSWGSNERYAKTDYAPYVKGFV